MNTWSKEELSKIAATDDLHIAPFREDGVDLRHPNLDLVRSSRRRPLRARLQRAKLSLVSGCSETEGGTDHRRRHDQGGRLRADRRTKP